MFNRLEVLLGEMDTLVSSALLVYDPKLQNDIFDFVGQVGEQVRDAFSDVHQVLGEVAFLRPSELNEDKVRQLQEKLSDTYARNKFKKVHKICDRVGALADHYRQNIEPRLSREALPSSSELFWLLEKHEGSFIYTICHAVDQIVDMLNSYKPGADIDAAQVRAKLGQRELRDCLNEVQRIESRIQASLPDGARKLLYVKRIADDVLRKSPWFSGGFYLAAALLLLVALTIVAGNVNAWLFPIVVASAFAGLTIIGAFQLRNDDRLTDENFVKLIDLSLRRILLPLTQARRE